MKKRIRYPSKVSDDPAESSLANFVHRMRMAKRGKRGYKITSDHIEYLESIPGWRWDAEDVNTRNCEALRSWMSDNGDRLPSPEAKDPEECRLGNFASGMRKAKRGKGRYKITSDHIEYLESIPGWWWDAEDVNMNNCVTLRSWMSDNGDRLPNSETEDPEERRLGYFATRMRRAKRGRGDSKLIQDHIEILESIPGWKWGDGDRTMNNCVKLRSWVNNGGRFPNERSEDPEERRLANLVGRMRRAKRGYSHHKITPDHIKVLESIPGWRWNPRKKK